MEAVDPFVFYLAIFVLAIFVGYVLLMFAVCLLACFVPTRRALGIDPVEALRAD